MGIVFALYSREGWGPTWIYVLYGPQLYAIDEEEDEDEEEEEGEQEAADGDR